LKIREKFVLHDYIFFIWIRYNIARRGLRPKTLRGNRFYEGLRDITKKTKEKPSTWQYFSKFHSLPSTTICPLKQSHSRKRSWCNTCENNCSILSCKNKWTKDKIYHCGPEWLLDDSWRGAKRGNWRQTLWSRQRIFVSRIPDDIKEWRESGNTTKNPDCK
jgi:hypothetical protein